MGSGGRTGAQRWLVAGIVVVMIGAIGALAWIVVPPIAVAAMTRVAATDETVRIVHGDRTASIPVPRGWSVRDALGDGSRVTLGSPDAVMTVELALSSTTETATTIGAIAPGAMGTETREPAGAGRNIMHAPTIAGDAVVGALDNGTSAVVFVSSPSPAYDAELARLLDGIEFGP